VKPSTRPVRLAAAAGLILASALAAVVGGYRYSSGEQAAEPETLQRIARKNEAAAMDAAARMEARSEAVTEARESAEPQEP
jgi:hypothetical protein